MRRIRSFAVERRVLPSKPAPVATITVHADREPVTGAIADDVHRMLRGRMSFPRVMISTEAGAH